MSALDARDTETHGHSTRVSELSREWARLGHDVTFYEKDVEYYYWRRDFREVDYCTLVLYLEWKDVRQRALRMRSPKDGGSWPAAP